jgi:DNA polymerase sigma
LGTVELVRGLSIQFPQLTPLALVLKQFLKDRNMHAAYTGGLSSYCLVLLVVAFLQQRRSATRSLLRPISTTTAASSQPPPPPPPLPHDMFASPPPVTPERDQDTAPLGPLLLDFLFFYGRVFDPRVTMVSVRAGDNFLPRRRVGGIDPLYIEDPFQPTNNIGRNCFRVVQIQKAFADAVRRRVDRAIIHHHTPSVLVSILIPATPLP